ncbi:hypothetical protein SRABI106_02302 [Rahnella aquatilis]|nr:hypothetical protein SRABI106_02302 [Rahnella aquatilis]
MVGIEQTGFQERYLAVEFQPVHLKELARDIQLIEMMRAKQSPKRQIMYGENRPHRRITGADIRGT